MKLIVDKQDINEISKLKGFHLKSRTYSLILLGEVIEYLSDPVRVLREKKALLKSNGKVLITTPNMPSFQ